MRQPISDFKLQYILRRFKYKNLGYSLANTTDTPLLHLLEERERERGVSVEAACAGSIPASADLYAYRQDTARAPPPMRVITVKVVT
jgi:hypothetical protein